MSVQRRYSYRIAEVKNKREEKASTFSPAAADVQGVIDALQPGERIVTIYPVPWHTHFLEALIETRLSDDEDEAPASPTGFHGAQGLGTH